MGLAARIYAVDHNDRFPPDILSMRDELGFPTILVCPLDPLSGSSDALTWETLDPEADQ